jgi:membrane protein YdbS with pleckstrin-like domain
MGQERLFFKGSPVWMVNLPYVAKCGAIAVALCLVAYVAFAHGWPFVWQVLVAALALLCMAAAIRVLRTSLIEIEIDRERVTVRTGAFTRRTSSVELYRIQTVESRSAWWQRMLGFGTLIIYSSDVQHPSCAIAGMADVENRRVMLTRAAIALRDAKGIREVNMGRV